MNKLAAFIDVLYQGKKLSNSSAWKNRQTLVNLLVGLFAAGLGVAQSFGFNMGVSDADLVEIAGGIGAIVGMFNAYTTTATSESVGVSVNGKTTDEPRGRGSPFDV